MKNERDSVLLEEVEAHDEEHTLAIRSLRDDVHDTELIVILQFNLGLDLMEFAGVE